jgi:membrane dipeptidase
MLLIAISVVLSGCHASEANRAIVNKDSGNKPPLAATQPGGNSPPAARHPIAIDMHADTAQRMVDEGVDINKRLSDGHIDALRMKDGGLDAEFFSVWVEPSLYGVRGPKAVNRAEKQIDAILNLFKNHPETWALALTAEDIRRNASSGKLSVLMGLEGGYAIDEKLENVERYYNLGVRYMSPTWSVSTSWAGSSGDASGQARGLNEFGQQVIREMNRVGMMVDVSHVSDRTFWDITKTSSKPIIASHSNCRAITNVPRNLSDDMLKAVANSGGVVCVVFYSEFVEPGWTEKREKVDAQIAGLIQQADRNETGGPALRKIARDKVRAVEYSKRLPPVPISHLVDHIDHIVKLIGINHVGIGSDYDGVPTTVDGLSDISQLPNLTAELARRGYSASDIEKILGGNMLRVMEQTQVGNK